MQMSRFSMVLAAAVLCSSLMLSSQAFADDKQQAIKLFSEGNKLREAEKYPEALNKYRAAYSLLPSFKIDYNIALTLEKMGRNAESVRAYEKFLETGAGKSPAKMIKLAQDKIQELKKTLAEVKVECNVAGAVVKVSGKEVGKTPLKESLLLNPGKHALDVQAEGQEPFLQELNLEAGKQSTVTASLKPKEAEKPETMDKPDWAGEDHPANSAAGDDASTQADLTQPAEDSASAKRSSKTIWAWTTLGVGLACAVGAGVMYGVGSSQVNAAYDEYSALDSSYTDESFEAEWADVEAAGNLYIGGHVLAGVAAAAVGVSIYMFVTRPDATESAAARGWDVALSVDGQSAGLLLRGGF